MGESSFLSLSSAVSRNDHTSALIERGPERQMIGAGTKRRFKH
jgi:hypothetical protein